MPGRSVIEWDKDDCAALGIIKIDLLGLRMMSVLQESIALVAETGGHVDLAHLPEDDPPVYAMLQKAETVGVFQVESRAQMATLPRIHPETFYDLVVQVAIIRPGPIVGDMVHPYIRRRRGREAVTYAHPSLEPILKRTLGVPLFQEQLLRMAMAAAGFSGTEAEELRRAFGFKRSEQRMAEVETKLRAGMARRGIAGAAAESIVHAITSFALYGFPESHATSFALLAYASAYLKVHHPAAFYASLLNNQPMGFYHASTIVNEGRRRGLAVLPIDVLRSDWPCTVELGRGSASPVQALRLGLRYVKGLRERAGRAIVAARTERPFLSVADLARRAALERDEVTALAAVGALAPLGGTRRGHLWAAAVPATLPLFADAARGGESERAGCEAGRADDDTGLHDHAHPLREMTVAERLAADYHGTGVTLGPHPMALRRAALARAGVLRAVDLASAGAGRAVRVAGNVIVRQRPGTAKGFVFLSLEDETGIANVIVTPSLFARHRLTLVAEPFLVVEGILQQQDGVVSVRARRVEPFDPGIPGAPSHDFG
jgi:error-prone DNA polymerase